MAITHPNSDILTTGQFVSQDMRLLRFEAMSRQGSGVIRAKASLDPLWHTKLTSRPMFAEESVDLEALINSLDGALNSFYVHDLRRPYPAAYPDGDFTDSGEIDSLPSDTSITLKSLPAGFVITRGDKFELSNGTTKALFQAMESVTADGSGETAAIEVRPALPAWAAADDAVVFKKPSVSMVMVPDSLEITNSLLTTVISFEAIQTR